MFGPLKKVNERELVDAVLAFGSGFYKCLRRSMDVSNIDMLVLQMEFPLLAISVTNTFIGLRQKNPRKLMAINTRNASMAYGVHFERLAKGQVSAASYAARLATNLADGQGAAYARIVSEESPGDQPQQLISYFLERVNAPIPAAAMDETINGVATSLSRLIDDLRLVGV